ncbi:MAG: 5'-3' exonuclease H3TH domain-containing protein [Eubacteriales bacterium]
MKEKILLVDGHNLLFRMFYGMPDEFYTTCGVKFNAVYGFGTAVSRVIGMLRPTHMFVAFDSPECGDRRQLDEAYKANRPDFSDAEPNDCPFTQLPAIYAMLGKMGVPYREIHGCEADDVISSYARALAEKMNVIIMSTDKDYWQLISESVSVLNYHSYDSTLVTPPTVEAKFGIRPEQFADFKCLVGDKSDNIVGVPGVGPKRAAELLNRFVTIEGIYDNLDNIEREATRRALESSRERMELNRRLICLNGGAPLPYDEEMLRLGGNYSGNLYSLSVECAEEIVKKCEFDG